MKYVQLDTSEIPQYEEIPAWERFNALHMVKLTCQTLDQRLHGLQRCINHASIQSVQIQAGAHTIFRTSADVDETPSQMIQLSTVEGGDLYFQDSSGVSSINHKTLLIFDTDSPYSMIFGKHMTMRSLLIPKKLVAEIAPEIVQKHRSLVATTTEFGNLQDAIFAGHRIDVERLIRSAIPLSESEAAFQNAFTVIAERYIETELTIGDIATDLHLSERQLARIFSARGRSSPFEWCIRQRLTQR
ncbi:hypothetical protein [Corynebacterium lubricantis]|uniref:hypothetical protein n=1 Tax=Corynebacterium lubricantis TaxID=541095 RepID=UPI00037BAEBC|nr:hypothetical protein [Corynebacterium lubricantis]